MKKLISILTLLFCFQLGYGQLVMTVQPSSGQNNGNDSGTATAGKDAWTNRYDANMNYGDIYSTAGSPRSNCNTSDYKSYFQFDVTDLPSVVDSVFFGVSHYPHTNYCYSNCNADFYFYYVTSAWDEMTLTQSNEPSEDTNAFYGPLSISFPNDFQNMEYDITAAYNAWKSGTRSNHGFTVYSPTVGCNNAAVTFNVRTSDDTVASSRPYLKIYYRYPASTSLINSATTVRTYPNPFTTYIKCDIEQSDRALLIDIAGRVSRLVYDNDTDRYNTAQIAPGLYILQIVKGNKTYYQKVYKQ